MLKAQNVKDKDEIEALRAKEEKHQMEIKMLRDEIDRVKEENAVNKQKEEERNNMVSALEVLCTFYVVTKMCFL